MNQLVRDAIESGRKDVHQIGTSGVYSVPFDVVDPYLRTSCAHCGCTMTTCLTCSQCGDIRYCGKKCQQESWKFIHKTYCKRHSTASIGKLCWQNLFNEKNTFAQISVTLREHEGLGQLMEAAIGQVLMTHHHLTLTAKHSDLKSMANIVSRRLQRTDPSSENGGNVNGLLTIAAAISTIGSEESDRALAQTPLFRCVARHYLFHTPRLTSRAEIEGQEILDIPLLSATVNLVHPGVNAPADLISRCVDATWEAIETCCMLLSQSSQQEQEQQQQQEQEQEQTADANIDASPPPPTTTQDSSKPNAKGSNKKKRNRNKKKKDNKQKKEQNNSNHGNNSNKELSKEEESQNHLKNGILPNLRMLARNLAYIGAKPYSQQLYERIPKIVVADFMFGMDDFDHEAIQVWATTAQNMVETTPGQPREEASSNDNNGEGENPISMSTVGNALISVIQVCAKARLGGADIVFRDGPPTPGTTQPKFVPRNTGRRR